MQKTINKIKTGNQNYSLIKLLLTGLLLLLLFIQSSNAESLKILIQDRGDRVKNITNFLVQFKEKTGIDVIVEPISGPPEYIKEIADSYLRAPRSKIDIFDLDSVWIPELRPNLVNLKNYIHDISSTYISELLVHLIGPSLEVYAIPYYFNIPILYYRKDLLEKYNYEPPSTWDKMELIADSIIRKEKEIGVDIWGYVFEAASEEGLVKNAFEWISSHDGGNIIEENGEISVNNPRAIQAIDRAYFWLGTITPPDITTYDEKKALDFWSTGNAVFLRYKASNDIVLANGEYDTIQLPSLLPEMSSKATADISTYAISLNSNKRELAAQLVEFLTSFETQSIYTNSYGWVPTRNDLFGNQLEQILTNDNPDLIKSNVLKNLQSFFNILIQPAHIVKNMYSLVNEEIFKSISATFAGQGEAERNIGKLQRRLTRVKKSNW